MGSDASPLMIEGAVIKITEQDIPDRIEIEYYDVITVNAFGISYGFEPGNTINIVEFGDENFKL